ncbi:DUF2065 domain-containing protein [Methyloraptor flagellatus]|uniref:DUF2065 domain-containing protein n=1 Tax=Methyloraptor flagellatus TaxID=3162530 RepID=A0AAU7XB46_9HYPH
MKDFVSALGLMLALEGALYAGAPQMMKKMMSEARHASDTLFRLGGLAALVIGVALVAVVRLG